MQDHSILLERSRNQAAASASRQVEIIITIIKK